MHCEIRKIRGLEGAVLFDDIRTAELVVCRELQKLREAERWLCAAFENLPAEQIPAKLTICFLYHLTEKGERLDRLELLLDIMESSPLETRTAVA